MKKRNWLIYIVLLSMFIGINIVMFVINSGDDDFLVSIIVPFHLIEFWGIFCFTLLELAIVYSRGISSKNLCLDILFSLIAVINIIMTFIPALMVTLSLEHFEQTAHWIEYTSQTMIIFVDILFFNLPKKGDDIHKKIGFFFSIFLLVGSIAQLVVFYGVADYDEEIYAHFVEFSLEGLNACVTLYFCLLVFIGNITIKSEKGEKLPMLQDVEVK